MIPSRLFLFKKGFYSMAFSAPTMKPPSVYNRGSDENHLCQPNYLHDQWVWCTQCDNAREEFVNDQQHFGLSAAYRIRYLNEIRI